MIRLTRSQAQPIGLDIGFDSIKMLQLETVGTGSGQSLALLASARRPMPDEARAQPQLRMALAVDVIRRMLREGGFHGKRVITSLPREMVHVKNLRLPLLPAHELASAVQFEARNIFPFDTDQAHIRHMLAGEVRQGPDVRQEVVVMAARFEDVDDYLEHLHHAGCVVESLDTEPLAIYRSVDRFIRRREDEQEVHVIVDIGARRSQVVIGKGKEISFLKSIEVGSQQLVDAICAKLGITIDEATSLRHKLAEAATGLTDVGRRDSVDQAVFDATRSMMEDLGREISLCLRYYSVTFRGQRPTRVKLAGGEAHNPQLHTILNTALTIPVEPMRPFFSVDIRRMSASERRGALSEWTLALGLGLRLTRGTFAPRDGKPREDATAVPSGGVEVVDLNQALRGAEATSAAAIAGSSSVPVREVANA